MKGISVVILTRNNVDGTFNLINNVYGIADEIILGDSSSTESAEELKSKCKKLDKISFFRCIPMSYPDPMRMYALKRCKFDWVLLMDSDEFLNDELKLHIRKLIMLGSADGFLMNRTNITESGSVLGTGDYQLRLYRKSKTTYGGLPHEFPVVSGKIETLDKKYAIMQYINLEDYAKTRSRKDIILIAFTMRLTYSDLLDKVSKYGALLRLAASVYLKFRMAKMEKELGRFEYYLITMYPVVNYLRKSFPNISYYLFNDAMQNAKRRFNYLVGLPAKDRLLQLNISQEIKKCGGVTQYLMLDNDVVVDALNRKFLDTKERGELLFGWLLYLRYTLGEDYYLHLKPFGKSWIARFG